MKKSITTFAFVLAVVTVFAGSDPMKTTSAKVLNLDEVASNIEYPSESTQNGVEGTVLMKIEIDENGNIKSKEAVSFPCTKLKEAVELAVEDLKFEPAKNGFGQAVTSTVKIPFAFELKID